MVGTGSWVQPTPASSLEGGENGLIPLRIRQGSSTVDLMVSGEDYYLLEKLRDNFAEENNNQGGAAASNPERVCLRFVESVILDGQSTSASKAILRSFEEKFLANQDIHSLAARSPASKDQEKDFIRSYFLACDACQAEPRKVKSALLEAASKGEVRIVDVFGGQGSCNLGCVQELIDLNYLYQPLIATLLKAVSPLLERLSTEEEVSDVFVTQPILIQQWIDGTTGTPSKEIIATAPYSIPINGLCGLAYYAMSCKVAGLTPGEMRMRLQGALGHSQGIAVAAAISAADSWEEFYEISRTTIETLFWIGYYSHRCSPKASLTAKLVADSIDNGEGRPSSLLSVRGLYRVQVDELIKKVNKSLSTNEHVFMALANSPSNFVLAGPANSLQGVNNHLRTMKIADNENQSRIPFNKRKPNVIHQFLPVSAPFHTSYLKEGAAKAKAAMSGRSLMSDRLAIAVYETHKGDDLRREPGKDLIHILIDAIMQQSADFPATSKLPGITHVVSFGASRVGDLVAQVKDGYGIRSIFAGDNGSADDVAGRKAEFFSPTAKIIKPASWVEKFAPRLENTLSGELAVSTKLTRFLGVPHVLVAGMTPTTVWWDVVSAIMNAGYHAELAGGGYYNAESMTAAIKSLIDSVPAGKGVTCNVIYSSPRSIGWQIPMFQKLVREGIPVDGLAIGAGVPSAEVINEYITTLGLRHIILKPGSYSAIQDTIAVAAAHPTFPIILQWTGGRGGGHHSYEDFHVPILDMYSEIRKHDNIFLVAGSGFGGAEDTYAYLTGTWSTDLFGRAPMPFDGILMGSRLMVAKEAHTSPQAKELICAAPGVDNIDDWTGSYEKPVGGVITVKSEMGQPIHKLATRGVLFWAEMDKIFAMPKDKMSKEIENKKAYIIRRLNADFAKPYFGVNAGGRSVDLSEMTYAEVISRIIDLMYVRHQKRWVHKSYEKFARIFMARTLERLYDTGADKIEDLSDPEMVMQSLLSTYPLISTSILDPDDEAHFVQQCKARGQKPVNFVPVIDDGLETWMKKDSLWQSEDVDAVINQDVGRVCILHGPVAAKFSNRSDQTAKEILDEICSKHIEMMKNNQPNGVDRLTEKSAEEADNQPSLAIAAMCSEEYVLRGSAKVANPLRRVLQLVGASSTWSNNGNKLIIKTLGKSQDYVEIDAVDSKLLLVKLHYTKPGTSSHISLQLFYEWHPERRFYQIEEQARQRNNQIKEFYKALWVSEPRKPLGTLSSSFSSPRITLTTELLRKVQRAVSMGGSEHLSGSIANDLFPLDTMIMISWDALIKPLLVDELDGDLLALVHLSNKAEYRPGVAPFKLGDVITGTSSIETLKIGKSGKTMQVRAELSRNGELAAVVTTAFFFRGQYKDFHQTFRHIEEPEWALTIENKMDEAILKSREWIKFDSSCPSLIGKTLLFRVTTTATWDKPDQMSSMSAKGSVLLKISPEESQLVGKIFIEKSKCTGNVVMDYLERKGHLANDIVKLTQPGWDEQATHELVIPSSNEAYSIVSSDCNPIHTAPVFAAWADLPGTITHGMYTSAMVRTVVESVVADGDRTRFRSFESKFTGMVMPGDVLRVTVQHVGMLDGCMVIDVKVYNKKTAVEVLEGTAIIEEVPTAFVFTGQGSQNKGMGMALYDSSPVAKKIWDDTDAFLLKTYGWSILEVVRNNPKTLKIHFGGKKGREIRANYLALTIQTTKPDGRVVMEPILKEINEHTTSHTFSEPRGLLFSTQFAQPAITLVSKAAFEDMKSKGLVAPGSTFAGHSLGEYGALSAFTEFIPFQTLMSVVFYRGLTMQVAMDRDEHGSTDFSMVAVNPSRVGKFMDETSTRRVLATIAGQSNGLMEIVNFNVKGEQYVAAGHLRNIHALGQVCDALATSPNATAQMKDFMSGTYEEGLTTDLGEFITEKVAEAQQLQKPFELQRGKATIPLKGIDVPFHSSYLRPSVPAYRRYLEDKLRVEDIVPERFIGKFIPNVMARPFSLNKEYFEEAARLTGSDVLKNIALTGAA